MKIREEWLTVMENTKTKLAYSVIPCFLESHIKFWTFKILYVTLYVTTTLLSLGTSLMTSLKFNILYNMAVD